MFDLRVRGRSGGLFCLELCFLGERGPSSCLIGHSNAVAACSHTMRYVLGVTMLELLAYNLRTTNKRRLATSVLSINQCRHSQGRFFGGGVFFWGVELSEFIPYCMAKPAATRTGFAADDVQYGFRGGVGRVGARH